MSEGKLKSENKVLLKLKDPAYKKKQGKGRKLCSQSLMEKETENEKGKQMVVMENVKAKRRHV